MLRRGFVIPTDGELLLGNHELIPLGDGPDVGDEQLVASSDSTLLAARSMANPPTAYQAAK